MHCKPPPLGTTGMQHTCPCHSRSVGKQGATPTSHSCTGLGTISQTRPLASIPGVDPWVAVPLLLHDARTALFTCTAPFGALLPPLPLVLLQTSPPSALCHGAAQVAGTAACCGRRGAATHLLPGESRCPSISQQRYASGQPETACVQPGTVTSHSQGLSGVFGRC